MRIRRTSRKVGPPMRELREIADEPRQGLVTDGPGLGVLAIGGCGGGDEAERASGPAGRDGRRRRVEHRLPDQQGGAGGLQPGQAGGHRRRRQPRHRRRLQPLSPGRGRHRRRLAAAKPDEEAKAKAQGIEWTRFLVGYDGITLVVNPKNDFVKSLIGRAAEGDLGAGEQGQDLEGRRPGLARPQDRALLARQRLGDLRVLHRGDRRQGQEPARRRAASSDDNILVNGVAGDPDGLGYFGYAYYAANKDKLRAVAGPERAPTPSRSCPSPATILDKTYRPLSRPLFIYVKNSAAAPARGRGVPQVLPRERRHARRRRRVTSPRRPRTRPPTRKALEPAPRHRWQLPAAEPPAK